MVTPIDAPLTQAMLDAGADDFFFGAASGEREQDGENEDPNGTHQSAS